MGSTSSTHKSLKKSFLDKLSKNSTENYQNNQSNICYNDSLSYKGVTTETTSINTIEKMVNLKFYFEDTDKDYNILFPPSGTFEDLVDKILELKIPLADDSFFLTKGKKIELDKKYDFEEDQKIKVRRESILEDKILINNVSSKTKDAIIKRKIHKVSNGCYYRYICQGINLYGICFNKTCKAYSQEVIQMINDNELNFVKKNGMMNCPLCNGPCAVKIVGFYKCYFNIYGNKFNEEKDEVEKFGVEIKDFWKQDINIDNTVLVNGKKVKVNKTDDEDVFMFNEYDYDKNIFLKLVFQIKKF